MIVPSASVAKYPHGAFSKSSPAPCSKSRRSNSTGVLRLGIAQILLHRGDGFYRRAKMRTMPGRFEDFERAAWQGAMHVFADAAWRDDIFGTLQDEGRHRQSRQIGPRIR